MTNLSQEKEIGVEQGFCFFCKQAVTLFSDEDSHVVLTRHFGEDAAVCRGSFDEPYNPSE